MFKKIAIVHVYSTYNKWYRNDPKFSDTQAWANSADPDQTAPRGAVWSGSTLFAVPSALLLGKAILFNF